MQRIVAAVEPYRVDRIYGAWWERVIERGGMEPVTRSCERYPAAIRERTGS